MFHCCSAVVVVLATLAWLSAAEAAVLTVAAAAGCADEELLAAEAAVLGATSCLDFEALVFWLLLGISRNSAGPISCVNRRGHWRVVNDAQ
jgi:hypothetical protein